MFQIKYAAIPRFTLSLNGFDPDALWGNNDPSSPDNRLDIWPDHDPYELVPAMIDIPVFVASGDGNAGPRDPPSTATDAINRARSTRAGDSSSVSRRWAER
jgi:hypothetical protein